MLGMGDFTIFAAYTLCILSALLCVGYGIVAWNKGADKDEPEVEKEWQQTEVDMTEKLDI